LNFFKFTIYDNSLEGQSSSYLPFIFTFTVNSHSCRSFSSQLVACSFEGSTMLHGDLSSHLVKGFGRYCILWWYPSSYTNIGGWYCIASIANLHCLAQTSHEDDTTDWIGYNTHCISLYLH